MILTTKQMKHLELYDSERFMFVATGHVTPEEKQNLYELDADYFEVLGFHIIINYDELIC